MLFLNSKLVLIIVNKLILSDERGVLRGVDRVLAGQPEAGATSNRRTIGHRAEMGAAVLHATGELTQASCKNKNFMNCDSVQAEQTKANGANV
jgi:hypothetical protein